MKSLTFPVKFENSRQHLPRPPQKSLFIAILLTNFPKITNTPEEKNMKHASRAAAPKPDAKQVA